MSGFEWSVWAILGMIETFFIILWALLKISNWREDLENDLYSLKREIQDVKEKIKS